MTQEEKRELLVALCGYLPYGVICQYPLINGVKIDEEFKGKHFDYSVECKPYLRPMSSMTEEEKIEATQFEINNLGPIGFNWSLLVSNSSELVNWLNKHHFDYRGLIPMGLALEAPEGMYEIVPTII